MGNTFEEQKQQFIQNYNQARPIMAILGDEVRQEILLVLIEAGGNGGIRVGDIQKRSHISRSAVSHDQKGLSCTLTSGAGGMGGKTGLYDVGVPIKENTKKGYKMAYEGDSIDLGYPGMNSRRGRVGRNIAHTLTTGSHQGTLHFVDMSVPPLVTEHARCLNTRQDSSIHNHKGEPDCLLSMNGEEKELVELYNANMQRIVKTYNKCMAKKSEGDMNSFLKESDWAKQIYDYIWQAKHPSESEDYRKKIEVFLNGMDINVLTSKLKEASLENLEKFRGVLKEIYSQNYAPDILWNEKEQIKVLIDSLKEFQENSTDKIRKYQYKLIADYLSEALDRTKNLQ